MKRAGCKLLPQWARNFPRKRILSIPGPLLLTRNHQQVNYGNNSVNFRTERNLQLKMSEVFHQSPIDESIIMKPYTYLYNIRMDTAISALVENMNKIIKAPQDAEEVIREVACMVARSYTLTDDITDNSEFRYNLPTAHQVFGVPQTLTASWYSLFKAAEILLTLKQPKAVELLVKHMKNMYEGQTMEILWRDSFQCPTEQEYGQMLVKRNGSFLSLVTDLLQLFVQDQKDFAKLNKMLTFQYVSVDDMNDLQSGQVESYCEDINEGKFGFPLVIAINRHPKQLDKCDIAAGMADKASRGSYIQSLLKESDALVCCHEIINELEADIRMEVNALGGSEIAADALLKLWF